MRALIVLCGLLMATSGLAQTAWTTIDTDTLEPGKVRESANSPRGGLTFYATLNDFNNAAGMTTSEDFEGGATAPGAVNTCVEPVNSMSNDPCFSPGDLVDGFSITSTGGGGVVALGDGLVGQPTTVVGANTFTDATVVTFNPPVTAVAFDIINGNAAADVDIELFDGTGASLGGNTATVPGIGQPLFQGFTSTTPIEEVVMTGATDSGELFDNLVFGQVGGGTTTSVPTLSSAGIALLIVLLTIIGGVVIARVRGNA